MGKRVVYLVDDSADETAFMRRALAAVADLEVTTFVRAEDALGLLLRARPGVDVLPDLVVLDVKMPGLDGNAFLRSLRIRFGPGMVPVVIFTSSQEPRDIRGAYEGGANSYVVKPVPYEAFAEKVAAVVRYWLEHNCPEPVLEKAGA